MQSISNIKKYGSVRRLIKNIDAFGLRDFFTLAFLLSMPFPLLSQNTDSGLDFDKYNSGVSAIERKSLDSAKFLFNSVRTKDNSLQSKAHYNSGYVYLKEAKYDSSMSQFEKALLLNPNDSNARYNFIYSKMKLKNNSKEDQRKKSQKDTLTEGNKKFNQEKKLNEEQARQLLKAIKEKEADLLKKQRLMKNTKDKTSSRSGKRW